jgi:hypothetical protein
MSSTHSPGSEQLTIELPVSVVSALRAEAEAQGRDISSVAADRLTNSYAVATNEPLGLTALGDPDVTHAALHGPARRFNPAVIRKEYQEKYGVPDLSHLSREELAEQADEIIAQMEPSKRANMERLGLI